LIVCIAIGRLASQTNGFNNSICFNASGVAVNPASTGLFISPVRNVSLQNQSGVLQYDISSKEIYYNNSPTVSQLKGAIYHTDQPSTAATYYLTFVQSAGASGYYDPCFDSATLTYNPNTNLLLVNGLQLSTTTNTVTYSGTNLSIVGNDSTNREFNLTISGNIDSFNIINRRTNGTYKVNISNSSGSTWAINNVLGTLTSQPNKTSYTASQNILVGDFWIMTIRVQSFAGTSYNCISLEKFV